ncbi:hypothetical protein EV361DRAFT_932493 [Lentinula raphanica]|uniref:Glycosyl transferase family 25 domain-containing protein n=1 Tax=Lentinula raphanica TaxID=153919 RepID=A0AA38NY43_9AGAR|nr:hypothetical protein F5878DRAFT_634219 [Lentinula raphanica]KAJ3967043.1 hypothetical protein EV361DRAFT_932493 [Lentinula raphanica]
MVAFGQLKPRHFRLIAMSLVLFYIYRTFNHSRFVDPGSDWVDSAEDLESSPNESSPNETDTPACVPNESDIPARVPNNYSFSSQVRYARESSHSVRHSRTLGTGALLVISLQRVESRRKQMDLLAKALDLDFTYINATDAQSSGPYGLPRVERIIDRVRWQRSRFDELDLEDTSITPGHNPTPSEDNPNYILDAFPFKWSKDALENLVDPTGHEIGISGSDYWTLELDRSVSGEGLKEAKAWEARHPMPVQWQNETWRKSRDARVNPAFVRNNLLSEKSQFLTLGGVACADSHIRAIREIIHRNLDSAIIFEDDIDIEFSIERILEHEWPYLPSTWDIVYLGHCWSSNEPFRPFLDPKASYVRKTEHTLCLHAHAISLRGAYKLARFLRSPDYAYSRPVDHMIKDLVQMNYLESYTFVPALVVQTKEDTSQIKVGEMNRAWKDLSGEWLVDSTLERIKMVQEGASL